MPRSCLQQRLSWRAVGGVRHVRVLGTPGCHGPSHMVSSRPGASVAMASTPVTLERRPSSIGPGGVWILSSAITVQRILYSHVCATGGLCIALLESLIMPKVKYSWPKLYNVRASHCSWNDTSAERLSSYLYLRPCVVRPVSDEADVPTWIS